MTQYVVLSLVVWRISYLLTHETGPYDYIERFRNWTLRSKASPLDCLYCTSLWISIVISVFTTKSVLDVLVMSGGAIFVHLIHERLS